MDGGSSVVAVSKKDQFKTLFSDTCLSFDVEYGYYGYESGTSKLKNSIHFPLIACKIKPELNIFSGDFTTFFLTPLFYEQNTGITQSNLKEVTQSFNLKPVVH